MAIELSLQKLGLSKQEAQVYVNTLKLGLAKASEIAQKSKVKREACYYILKLLKEKAFISEVIKSGVKYYSSVNPKAIFNLIEDEMREKKEALEEILPELDSLQKIALTIPKIEVYEGVEGFKTIVAKLIEKPNQDIFAYVPENILHFLPAFHLQFRRRRKEKNVKINVITKKTSFMEGIKMKDKEEIRETRFNENIMKNIDSAYFILADAVLIIKANEKEQLGIYIKEESTARLQRNVFEEAWKKSEK